MADIASLIKISILPFPLKVSCKLKWIFLLKYYLFPAITHRYSRAMLQENGFFTQQIISMDTRTGAKHKQHRSAWMEQLAFFAVSEAFSVFGNRKQPSISFLFILSAEINGIRLTGKRQNYRPFVMIIPKTE